MERTEHADLYCDAGRTVRLGGNTYEVWVQERMERQSEWAEVEYIHAHLRYEVHVAGPEGLRVRIENRIIPVGAGELLIVAPNVYHYYIPSGGGRRCFSYYRTSGGRRSPLEIETPYLRCRQGGEMGRLLELVEENRAVPLLLQGETEEHLFSCVMIALLRGLSGDAAPEKPAARVCNQNLIEVMEQYFDIQQNIRPSKKELASLLAVSERQLERILQATYGMGFREKVRKTRFETARFLLENLHYSAEHIAEIVGFSSGQTFYAAYRAYLDKHKPE